MKFKLGKSQWEQIGKVAGWSPINPSEVSDADIDPSYDPDSEESALFGEDESYTQEQKVKDAFEDGHKYGLEHNDTLGMPYRQDTENGIALAKAWFDGFKKARDSKSIPSYVHETINPPTRGKMHRCKQCWTEVDKTDNGFKPYSVPYPHSDGCKYKGRF